MARVQPDQDLVPSVFDRLIDREPGVSTEPAVRRSVRLAQLKESVKRDLEWLLNCKQPILAIPAELRHLRNSLLTFGLPDFTHSSLTRSDDQRLLQQTVEASIRRFEPRLKGVVVTLVEGREFDRGLRFRIDASLDVEPAPEPVTFDSVLELSTKAFRFPDSAPERTDA
jgi:type VI secretion system protein ImpF